MTQPTPAPAQEQPPAETKSEIITAVTIEPSDRRALPESTALTSTRDDSFKLALDPTDFHSARELSALVAKSGMFGITNPDSAFIRILTGRSLGIPAAIALREIYDVYGRPAISARLKVSLTLRHPQCETFEYLEGDNTYCIYVIKRKGRKEKRFKFTIQQAKDAQLVKQDSNWMKWPHRMLQARASSEASDVEFPDVCMGLPTREEAEDDVIEMPEQPKVIARAAQVRDFGAEVAALKRKVDESTTKETDKAVFKECAQFMSEAGEPHASEIKKYWNEKKGAKGPKPTEPQQTLGGT